MSACPSPLNLPGPRLLLLCVCLLSFALPAGSEEIHKWKDKNGVVHYGDQENAPADSAKMQIKGGKGTPPAPAPGSENWTGRDAPSPKPPQSFGGFSASQIGRCADYARDLINNNKNSHNGNPSGNGDTKTPNDQLKATCPGVSFSCTSYYHFPQKNQCEPTGVGPKNVVEETWFDFPCPAQCSK
jgi:Domain of unknown function (DUF4124)